MKRVFPLLLMFLLSLNTLGLVVKVQQVRAATVFVPDDYSTIQSAIDNANPGDTIHVRAGTYVEHLQVNKPVVLTGEGNGSTIITGSGGGIGILITASNVTFEDFLVEQGIGCKYSVFVDGRNSNCSFVAVRDNKIVDTLNQECEMLDVLASEHDTISGNEIIMGSRDSGIVLEFQANHNLVDNNTVVGGWTDLFCDFSEGDNVFSNNYVANQTLAEFNDVGAMFISITSNIVVRGNTFVNNAIAFSSPDGQPGVTLYHNNFINNTVQVLSAMDPNLKMDNGYPSGGNYWSDYNGSDVYSGPYQNVTGKDGIGDTPHIGDALSSDNYPLMKPWAPPTGDLNGDGIVSLQDLVLFVKAYESRPGDPSWNPLADIASPYGIVNLADLVTLAMHYGQHNP